MGKQWLFYRVVREGQVSWKKTQRRRDVWVEGAVICLPGSPYSSLQPTRGQGYGEHGLINVNISPAKSLVAL